jgi:hypothetical protein
MEDMKPWMRVIAIEEHFATPAILEGPGLPGDKQSRSSVNPEAAARAAITLSVLLRR